MMNGGDALGTMCPTAMHRKIFCDEMGFKSLDALPSDANAVGFRTIIVRK